MSLSSVQRTINILLREDLIYQDQDGFFKVLNPVIKTVFAKNTYFEL